MATTITIYNILHPIVDNTTRFRSEDEQVNGIGFYRTVANGTEGLLIERAPFPEAPAYSLTNPVVEVPSITPAQLLMQWTILAPNYHFHWTYGDIDYGYTTAADREAILAGADGSTGSLTNGILNFWTLQYDTSTYVTYAWELLQLAGQTPVNDEPSAWGTYPWEGINLNQPSFEGVGSRISNLINNASSPTRNIIIPALPGGDGTVNCFCTQRWETQDMEVQGFSTIAGGNENSEDSQGRRATYRWEIAQQGIEQTWWWAYHDVFSDTALGQAVELDNYVPPATGIVAQFQEHLFLAGDPFNPHYLYWSKRFRPEAYPLENFIEIGTAADPIKAISPSTGVLGVFTNNTKYRVQGNATSGFIHDEAISHRGAPAPRSVVPTEKGVMFVARDGVFVTNFLGPDTKISDAIDALFIGEDKNEYDRINWDVITNICAGFYKNKYYFSYPAGTSTINNMTAIYSLDTQGWTFWDIGFASFFSEPDIDSFLAGDYAGQIRRIEVATAKDDLGTFMDYELQTHDFTTGNRNLFTHYIIDANLEDDSATAEFYVDEELIRSATIQGNRTQDLISLPTDSFGIKWRMRIVYTGNRRIAVYGVTAIYIPLLAA